MYDGYQNALAINATNAGGSGAQSVLQLQYINIVSRTSPIHKSTPHRLRTSRLEIRSPQSGCRRPPCPKINHQKRPHLHHRTLFNRYQTLLFLMAQQTLHRKQEFPLQTCLRHRHILGLTLKAAMQTSKPPRNLPRRILHLKLHPITKNKTWMSHFRHTWRE